MQVLSKIELVQVSGGCRKQAIPFVLSVMDLLNLALRNKRCTKQQAVAEH